MRVLGIAVGLLALITFSSCSDDKKPKEDGMLVAGTKISVKRDIQGFPHIDAPSEVSAYFGLGYMQAEDHRAELLLKLGLVSGRAAELFDNRIVPIATGGSAPTSHIFGEDDLPVMFPPIPQLPSLVDFDKTVRFYGYFDNAKSIYEKLSDEDRKKLEAFTQGINTAIERNLQTWLDEGDFRYPLFHEYKLFTYRATALDVIKNSLDLFTWGYVMNFQRDLEQLHGSLAEDSAEGGSNGALRSRMPFSDIYRKKIYDIQFPEKKYKSSNQWAFLKGDTGLQSSIHVTDPHIPIFDVQYSIYGFQLRYPGGMVAGGTLTGFPHMLIGTNGHVTWSHTAHHDGTATLWSLELGSGGNQYRTYRTNGFTNFQKKKFQIKNENGDYIPFEVSDTSHGRVIYKNVDSNVAVSFRLGRNGEYQIFKEYYALSKAKSVAEFQSTLKMLQVPTFNTFVTDHQNIFYFYNSITPRRSDSISWNRIMNAQESDTDWDPNDLLTYEELPKLQNPPSGYLVNCNISPDQVTRNSGLTLSNFPSYLVFNNTRPFITYRQQKAREIIDAKLEEVKSENRTLSVEEIYAMVNEKGSLKYSEFVLRVVATYELYLRSNSTALSSSEINNVRREVQLWSSWQEQGAQTNKESTVMPRIEYFRFKLAELLNSNPSEALKTFYDGYGRFDLSQITPLSGDIAISVLRLISQVQSDLIALGANTKTWGDVHRIFTLTGLFPVSGAHGTIRASDGTNIDGANTIVQGGQTWVQAVFHRPNSDDTSSTVMKPFWGPLRSTTPWYNNATQRFSEEVFENFFIRKGELTNDQTVESFEITP